MVLVPRRIRPNQVIQAFVSILRMEFDSEFVNVRLSIVRDNVEYTGGSLRFDRPSSRLIQLQVHTWYIFVMHYEYDILGIVVDYSWFMMHATKLVSNVYCY